MNECSGSSARGPRCFSYFRLPVPGPGPKWTPLVGLCLFSLAGTAVHLAGARVLCGGAGCSLAIALLSSGRRTVAANQKRTQQLPHQAPRECLLRTSGNFFGMCPASGVASVSVFVYPCRFCRAPPLVSRLCNPHHMWESAEGMRSGSGSQKFKS